MTVIGLRRVEFLINLVTLSRQLVWGPGRSLAHLSPPAVREFYERTYQDCRLIYNRLPSPKQIQTLVQVWKQLWKVLLQLGLGQAD